MKRPAAIQVLHNRDFRLYWIGQAVSLTGTWMQVMAQGWVVTSLTRSAAALGALNVATTLPMLLLSMHGGALADRLEKRRILIVTQIAMMVLAFALAALVFTQHIALWSLFTLAVLLGIATAYDLPAAQALPPELVRKDEIPHAVALMQAIFHGARLVGPAIAGILVAQFGEGSAFLANGISFLAVIATLLLIHGRKPAADGGRGRGRGGITAGFRYVRHERLVGSLIGLSALATTFVFPFIAVLMVYYVRHVLEAEAGGLGIIMSASGFGALTGAIALMTGDGRALRRWLLVGILGCSAGMLGLSFVHHLPAAVPLVALTSFSVSSFMGRIAQTIQHVVPDELRGRVMAVFAMTFTGLMPYAALALSAIADVTSFERMLQICVGLFAVLGLMVLARVPPLAAKQPSPEPSLAA